MPRPTYDLLLATLESHPRARLAEQASGLTPAMIAKDTILAMRAASSQSDRDAILRSVMGAAGLVVESEASFTRESDRLLNAMSDRAEFERNVAQVSAQAREAGETSLTLERVAYIARAAQHAGLQQGISERMRESDAKAESWHGEDIPLGPRVEHQRDDDTDRRAAIHAAIGTANRAARAIGGSLGDSDGLRLREDVSERIERERGERSTSSRYLGDSIGLRETLEAAFDVHAERDALRDPLEDGALRSASNAV